MLSLLRAELLLELGPVLKGLNEALIAHGILPQLPSSYQIRETASKRDLACTVGSAPALLQQLRSLLSFIRYATGFPPTRKRHEQGFGLHQPGR